MNCQSLCLSYPSSKFETYKLETPFKFVHLSVSCYTCCVLYSDSCSSQFGVHAIIHVCIGTLHSVITMNCKIYEDEVKKSKLLARESLKKNIFQR